MSRFKIQISITVHQTQWNGEKEKKIKWLLSLKQEHSNRNALTRKKVQTSCSDILNLLD